nr:hypothetical protein BaRGS_006142 [Batillaria attramentaria]
MMMKMRMMTFGDASVAQAVLGGPSAGGAITIAWSFGVGITLGVFVSGKISGGHINPAVSVAMVCLRKTPLRKLPAYMLAQYLGGFVASFFIWCIYYGCFTMTRKANICLEKFKIRTESVEPLFNQI